MQHTNASSCSFHSPPSRTWGHIHQGCLHAKFHLSSKERSCMQRHELLYEITPEQGRLENWLRLLFSSISEEMCKYWSWKRDSCTWRTKEAINTFPLCGKTPFQRSSQSHHIPATSWSLGFLFTQFVVFVQLLSRFYFFKLSWAVFYMSKHLFNVRELITASSMGFTLPWHLPTLMSLKRV